MEALPSQATRVRSMMAAIVTGILFPASCDYLLADRDTCNNSCQRTVHHRKFYSGTARNRADVIAWIKNRARALAGGSIWFLRVIKAAIATKINEYIPILGCQTPSVVC